MNDAAAKYRSGTYTRGEDTRRRLVETAIEAFGTNGYDGTTTRMLAEHADVTLPSIQYYFGSKEGLYRAAIEHIIGEMEGRLEDVAARARATLANSKATRQELLSCLCGLLDALSRLIVGGYGSRKRFISRADIERSAALTPLHEQMRRHMIEPCAGLLARLIKRRPDDPKVIVRTLALIGQVSVFCHSGARRILGVADLGESQMAMIQDIVREHCKAIVDTAARESSR